MTHPKSNIKNNNNIRSLDERENYYSYILSPFTNHHHKKKPLARLDSRKVENAIKHGDYKKCEGDINCEAEIFIRQKHRKLERSNTRFLIIE
ncbi:hypothetical protein BVRB_6g146670 [Beta vulgaris subsp. vulgaris]|nr:hypothetical protein BVRB_6g146670 [Beta vulgaris subsp. vulgaris]